jgi:glyoxylase-like metal-dependent hydrolase (beta-lactamase superfamily II)
MSEARYVVSIIRHGTRSTTKDDVYLNYNLYGEPDVAIEMDYFAWLIRNETTTVVVDTGYSRHGGESRNRTFLLDLPQTYAKLGVDPESAPPVVITHAHYDHTGNLDHFPKSDIYLAEDELAFWNGAMGHRVQFHHSIEEEDLAGIRAAEGEGRLKLFRGELELAPGIQLIQLGGHTPGQTVVKVATSEGTVLLASDAVHFYEEWEEDRPFTYMADLVDSYEAFDRITEMVDSGEVRHVVSGHDADTLGRFTQVDGEFAGAIATIGEL